MSSESIAREDERKNCFSKIQLVGKKISRQNNFSQKKAIQPPLFWFSKLALVGYNI